MSAAVEGKNSLLTFETESRNIDTNARSISALHEGDVPHWIREYPIPEQLHLYLLRRRQALLLEVSEIERLLNIAPRKVLRHPEL